MQLRGYARKVDLDESWVRLYTPDGEKHGGGLRVNKISFSDDWANMGDGISQDYGQIYEYKMKDPANPGEEISMRSSFI